MPNPPVPQKAYHCGTLTYSKMGLFAVFSWMLWGDFCFTLMEAVVPSVLPLKLKDLGCANWLIGMVMTTVPGILNMTVCPYISFQSDRYRSRWGRRIPFILGTMPFLCATLALIGWSDDIAGFLHAHSTFLQAYAPATITILLIAVFIAMFQFFNMFVGSVFYYLFNDVIPPQFLARFTGAYKIVGIAAAAAYNYFIFQYAESHMREIFLGAGALYFIGFGMMCFMVKEGEYPPVEAEPSKKPGRMQGVREFFKESFTHKIYWLIFFFTTFGAVTGAINTFNVFFYKNMGLSLLQIGKMTAMMGIASLLAVYLASIYIDRWHPLRVTVYVVVFSVIGNLMNWKWVFISLPGDYFFWLTLGVGLITAFAGAIGAAGHMPLFYRVFPKSRFGQFCSAQSMVKSSFVLCAGIAAGLYIDGVKYLFGGSDVAYRFIFVWQTLGSVASAILIIYAYREWYRLGGDAHFHPPATWSPQGFEEMAIVSTVGPQWRWLNVSFHLFNAIMAVSVLGIPSLMCWMYYKGAMVAFEWHAWLLFPLSILAWVCWRIVEKGIRSDMGRARSGETPRNGIPHHGVFIFVAGKFLLVLGLWFAQVVVAVNLNMQAAAVIFTAANILTDFLLIGAVQLLCRIERGFSTTIDKNLAESAA
jgi:MFS family permease